MNLGIKFLNCNVVLGLAGCGADHVGRHDSGECRPPFVRTDVEDAFAARAFGKTGVSPPKRLSARPEAVCPIDSFSRSPMRAKT